MPRFSAENVLPVAISVDSPDTSRDLKDKAGFGFLVLSDPNASVIRQYGLLHTKGGPDGHDISRPAELLVDPDRVVRWTNYTEDVRVRAKADQMLAAVKELH